MAYIAFQLELQRRPDGLMHVRHLESAELKMNVEAQTGEMARRVRTALGNRGEMTPADLEVTVDASP